MTIKVYKLSDRVPVTIGELTFKLAPVSYDQKMEIASCYSVKSGDTVKDLNKAGFLAVKYAVKDVEGLEYADGTKFELKFENGVLIEESVQELFLLEANTTLYTVCLQLLNGVLGKSALKGVKILPIEGSIVKKK